MVKPRYGPHEALRWTQFCILWRCAPLDDPAMCNGDKSFGMHSIGYHMRGGWDFHGKRRKESVDAASVIAGSPGQYYGCKHSAIECDSVCAISLRPGALDNDESPIFERQILPRLTLPSLHGLVKLDDDDQFDSIVFEVFDRVSRASLPKDGTHRTDFRVQRMKRFIEQHALEDITLVEIARNVGLSPFTSIRKFKESAGSTPLRYVRHLRLERAKALLKQKRLSVAEVARQVGISDRFYFSRLFSRQVGLSPQAFRALHE